MVKKFGRWEDVYHYGFGYTRCPYCGDKTTFLNPFKDTLIQMDYVNNKRTHCPNCKNRVYAREGLIINQPPQEGN